MTFKLRSQVAIYASLEYVPPVEHVVLTRERVLRPGDTIRTVGSVATDVEGQKPWASATVKIRIIDPNRLGVRWEKKWPFLGFGGYFDNEETIIDGKAPLELEKLGGSYHKIHGGKLPEAFTMLDNIRLPKLIARALKQIGDGVLKDVRRKTVLMYEPTLPIQSRR